MTPDLALLRCPDHENVKAISEEALQSLNRKLSLECFPCFYLAMDALTPDGEWFPDAPSIQSLYGTVTRYMERQND